MGSPWQRLAVCLALDCPFSRGRGAVPSSLRFRGCGGWGGGRAAASPLPPRCLSAAGRLAHSADPEILMTGGEFKQFFFFLSGMF